jgi:hypothetical protein
MHKFVLKRDYTLLSGYGAKNRASEEVDGE